MANQSEGDLSGQIENPETADDSVIRKEFLIEGFRSYHELLGDVIAGKPQQESKGWWPGTRDDYVNSLLSMQQILEGMRGLQRYRVKITIEAEPLGDPET